VVGEYGVTWRTEEDPVVHKVGVRGEHALDGRQVSSLARARSGDGEVSPGAADHSRHGLAQIAVADQQAGSFLDAG
jgi:hypothetical protein